MSIIFIKPITIFSSLVSFSAFIKIFSLKPTALFSLLIPTKTPVFSWILLTITGIYTSPFFDKMLIAISISLTTSTKPSLILQSFVLSFLTFYYKTIFTCLETFCLYLHTTIVTNFYLQVKDHLFLYNTDKHSYLFESLDIRHHDSLWFISF